MGKGVELGRIDCPTCGTKGGMRFTADRNGDPFGFCDAECGQQMRVGGNARRVAAFRSRYPWSVPVTVTEPKPVQEPEKAAKPVPEREPKPEAKKAKPGTGTPSFLELMGIKQ